jgi:DnaJ-class molecular chaperone
MDIFKMASQIASSMSDDDRNAIENMDMEKMLSHVTQNVFKMMNGTSGTQAPDGLTDFMDKFNLGNLKNINEVETETVSESESESCILPKTRDIRFDLNVELSDFYNGKNKKLNIKCKRTVIIDGKQKVVDEKKRIVIPIERGMKDEQQIRFEGQADQIPGYTPGDIIITLIEIEHPDFQRDNNNLIIVKNINLYQIYDYSFNITHLDNRLIVINKQSNDALHLNESLRKVTNQGMPIYKSEKYGDLFIRFNLVIPKSLNLDKLSKLKEIFENELVKPTESNFSYVLENVNDTDLEELGSDYFDESESSNDSDDSDDSEDSGSSVSSVSSEEVKYVSKRR